MRYIDSGEKDRGNTTDSSDSHESDEYGSVYSTSSDECERENFYGKNLAGRSNRRSDEILFRELLRIARMRGRRRASAIRDAQKRVIESACEYVLNILRGNVALSPRQYRDAKKRKVDLRKLASRRTSDDVRRRILLKGGLLPLIVNAVAPLMSR